MMKRIIPILLLAVLVAMPSRDVWAQYRKKVPATQIIKEGQNKRQWLRDKADTSWHPTPGGLYDQVTNPEANVKKGKKSEPIFDTSGKRKVRETAYDTVFKFTEFDAKKFYFIPYDYNKFRKVRWEDSGKRDWEEFTPVWRYLISAGRIPMHLCAVYAINPNVTDPDLRSELKDKAEMEALISLDYFRDILIEEEMKNKINYKIVEVDYRYWKGESYFIDPQPTDEIIRVGVVCDFSSKKIDLFPSAAAAAKSYADIKFFANDATIQPSFLPEVEDLAQYLKDNPDFEVLLTGHSDNVGTEVYNMGLSRQRAIEVKKALMRRGIEDFRIEIIAKGDTEPVGDNNTLAGRTANNRVTVVIQ